MAFFRAAGALVGPISCGLVAGRCRRRRDAGGLRDPGFARLCRACRSASAGRRFTATCLGGLGYALLGSSRQLAIGPTSAISLMIAATVGAMADGDAQRYAQIASLTAFTVAVLCLIAWLLRLSALVKLISDSILVGFKAGAALTIAMTQLPSLLGVAGGGHNFFERAVLLAGQLGQTNYLVLAVGHRRDHAARARRAHAAGKTGRARRRCAVDRRRVRAWASCPWGGDDRRDSGRPADPGGPGAAAARYRGHRSARRRMPAARLYRERVCRPHLRGKARVWSGPAAGVARHRRGKSRSGAWGMAIPWRADCRNRR